MAQGGFNLRKWLTNDAQLRDKISIGNDAKHDCVGGNTEETFAKTSLAVHGSLIGQKVLGLACNCETDMLSFDLTIVSRRVVNAPSTKRTMLSLLACFYDPLGYYCPVTVSMKIFFQQLCCGEAKTKWENWVDDLNRAREIKIPRCVYEKSDNHVIECFLHGFGDASKAAYSTVVYLVYKTQDGSRSVRMLASKSRVAPLTIPRLELMSARILAQLMNSVGKALESQLSLSGRKFWLDSKTALCWIRNKGEWKQFVQHRVNEILRLTDKAEWGHCPVHEEQTTPESIQEEKRNATILTVIAEPNVSTVVDISKSSSFEKVVRINAWVMRFVSNMKALTTKTTRKTGILSVEELLDSEKKLIISAQIELKGQSNFRQII